MRAAVVLVALVAVGAAGCGGGRSPAAGEHGPIGVGADRYWLFVPEGKPKAVVLTCTASTRPSFDPRTICPGSVICRRRATPSCIRATRSHPEGSAPSATRSPQPRRRSNGSATRRYRSSSSATRAARGLPWRSRPSCPASTTLRLAVFSVFPSLLNPAAEEQIDLASADPATKIVLLVGDQDRSVGRQGARQLLGRLEAGAFPPGNIEVVVVRSRKGFTADHLAPLRSSKAVRDQFWARADRLIASTEGGQA